MKVNQSKVKEILEELDNVTLIAATKYVTVNEIKELEKAGVRYFGENRVQALLEKYEQYQGSGKFIMIGTLQKNKVKYIIDKVCMIQSVDSIGLLDEIEKQASKHHCIMPVLLQINIAKEASKHGFNQEDVINVLHHVDQYNHLVVNGFMMMAPNDHSASYYFKKTKEFVEEIKGLFPMMDLKHLSMGMSNDYKEAMKEGATMVRLGSILLEDE